MKDRFGNPINVGWPEHHILWLEAAMSLPARDRAEAFQDIADLTGRSFAAVYQKHCAILRERQAQNRRARLTARAFPARN